MNIRGFSTPAPPATPAFWSEDPDGQNLQHRPEWQKNPFSASLSDGVLNANATYADTANAANAAPISHLRLYFISSTRWVLQRSSVGQRPIYVRGYGFSFHDLAVVLAQLPPVGSQKEDADHVINTAVVFALADQLEILERRVNGAR